MLQSVASSATRRFLMAAGAVVLILLGYGLGHAGAFRADVVAVSCKTQYVLLNPWLRCEESESLRKLEYNEFREDLERRMSEHRERGTVEHVSVYFRDLENGPWFGLEEDALFAPASMLKVPLLMTYLREAQRRPDFLAIAVDVPELPVEEADQTIDERNRMTPGTYTLQELLERMIMYSDNNAMYLLGTYLDQFYPSDDLFAETLASMGIAKSEQSLNNFLTVKRYAAFYRALYNASYLSKEMSQRALELLAKTNFREGLVAGIPEGTTVAHKFGEREELEQLHDCGIVYHPDTPYILCIMTKGGTFASRKEVIAEVSRSIYDEVTAHAALEKAAE